MAKSQTGNLYHRILKLPPHITEPDAYQLLGVPRYEQDVKKIKQAAMDRNALLQRKQNAENYEDVKRIEREVGEALVCLTDPESKADYDRTLASEVSLMEPPPVSGPPDRVTQSLSRAEEGTVEVQPFPEETTEKPAEPQLPPLPGSGSRKFPSPRSGKTPAENKPAKDGKAKQPKNVKTDGDPDFMPGEAPWGSPGKLWQRQTPGIKGLVVGLPLLLLLGLVIAFWPSGSADDADSHRVVGEDEREQPVTTQRPISADGMESLTSRVLFRDESGGLEDVVLAGDGRWIATLGREGAIRLWDKFSGAVRLLDLPTSEGNLAQVTSLAAMPDGSHLFAATSAGTLLEWSLAGLPQSLNTSPQVHPLDWEMHALHCTGDGQLVVGLDPDANFVIFNRATSAATRQRPNIRGAEPLNLWVPRPDSDRMAIYCTDQTIRLWNPEDEAEELPRLVDRKATKAELALAFSSDGSQFAAAGADHQIRLADLNDPDAAPVPLMGHTDRIYSLSFSPDGKLLASAGADRSVRLWNTKTGKELTRLGGHKQPILSLKFSDEGEALYTASRDGTVRRWSVAGVPVDPPPILPAEKPYPGSNNPNRITSSLVNRLEIVHQFTLPDAKPEISRSPFSSGFLLRTSQAGPVVISPDGLQLARRETNGRVLISDTQTGRARHLLPVGTSASLPVRFSPDGRTLIVVQDDGWISCWDTATGRLVDRASHSVSRSTVNKMDAARQTERWAVVDRTGDVQVHADFDDLNRATSLPSRLDCDNLRLTPDGQFLVLEEGGRRIEVWDLGNPGEAIKPTRVKYIALSGFNSVRDIAVSPNAEVCVVGLATGKMGVYSVQTGKEVASFSAHSGAVDRVTFDAEGQMLFSSGADSEVRIWNALGWGNQLARLPKPRGVSSPELTTPGFPASRFGSSPTRGSESRDADPVVGFQVTRDSKQVVVVHQSGWGAVWEVGTETNPATASSPLPADLKITGPPQNLKQNNMAALSKWEEFPAHADAITHMAFTPENEFLITAGDDGAIRFWATQTGDLHHVLSFSPSFPTPSITEDPESMIGSDLGRDFSDLFQLRQSTSTTKPTPRPPIQHLAVSSTNRIAATADGRAIRLWNAVTGANQGTLGSGRESYRWFGFSPDGNTLVAQSGTQTLQFWDLTERKPSPSIPVPGGITAAAISPASGPFLLATANSQGEILLWKSETEKTRLKGNGTAVRDLAFSPDGKLLASCNQSGKIRIEDLEENTILVEHAFPSDIPSDLVFTPEGKVLLLVSDEGPLRALSTDPDQAAAVLPIRKMTAGNRLALSHDGKLLALTRQGTEHPVLEPGAVELWGVGVKPSELSPKGFSQNPAMTPSPKPYFHPQAITRDRVSGLAELAQIKAHKDEIWSVDFTPDGSAIVCGGDDTVASVWDAFSHQKIQTLNGHTNRVLAVAASPDNQHIVTASSGGLIKWWDWQTGEEKISRHGHSRAIHDLAFSSDGRYLASASQDRTVKVWIANSLRERNQLSGHTNTVTGVTWWTDTKLISVDRDNRIRLWNPLQGQEGKPLTGHGTDIEDVASTRGQKIAFASNRNTVGLFTNVLVEYSKEKQKNVRIWSRLTGHKDTVNAVAFSPDESVLVSASADHTLKFWNADTAEFLHSLTASEHQIHCLSFSPDGRWLITGDSGGILRIWGLK